MGTLVDAPHTFLGLAGVVLALRCHAVKVPYPALKVKPKAHLFSFSFLPKTLDKPLTACYTTQSQKNLGPKLDKRQTTPNDGTTRCPVCQVFCPKSFGTGLDILAGPGVFVKSFVLLFIVPCFGFEFTMRANTLHNNVAVIGFGESVTEIADVTECRVREHYFPLGVRESNLFGSVVVFGDELILINYSAAHEGHHSRLGDVCQVICADFFLLYDLTTLAKRGIVPT